MKNIFIKKTLTLILFTLFIFQFSFSQILPTPMEVTAMKGVFKLQDNIFLAYDKKGENTARYLSKKLEKSSGFHFKIKNGKITKGILFTTVDADTSLGLEGYVLKITPELITIQAMDETGMFYAVQSLFQLFSPEIFSVTKVINKTWAIPCQTVKDKPKYSWRSFMLDSGRQFQSTEFIKRYIDIMAMLKMNIFHWHLTEGQGWRLEIKKYPLLTEVGSRVANGKEQQGYYTQEQVRDIVKYASQRHITIVPEIDVPGHSEAALTAYPEYTCLKKAPESVMTFSSHLFCGGSERTYNFLQDVLDEVMELFPSSYIHLGGDEAPKSDWDACAVCQKKIKEKGLKNADELQLYFSKRLANYLKTKHKKVILWGDVVYKDGISLPDNVTIQWWNWRKHKDLAYRNAINRGHHVIAATNYYSYLNFPVTPWSMYKESHTFDMKTAYEQNPSDFEKPNPLVLGMSASLWTDWHVQQHMVDRRVFPRVYALAEQMWHIGTRLSYEDFYKVVKSKYSALSILNIDVGPASKQDMNNDYSWDK